MTDLLSRDVLVISQRPKLIELTAEYEILDPEGNKVGSIRQEGQSKARKVLRFLTSVDQFLTHRLAVYDAGGTKVLEMMRPAKFLKSRVHVTDGSGREVGTIVQQNVLGKKRFTLAAAAGGAELGWINAENWRAWDFAIAGPDGAEVGRITKKWAGLLREGFTTADKYVLQISAPVTPDMRLMMLASAAGVDLALKQDEGLGGGLSLWS